MPIIARSLMLTIDDIHAAARRLLGRIHRTPVISSQSLDEATGLTIFLKCENLQRAGSFKIRGALNKLSTLSATERARGVVAFSSGNHAQGVALAARMVGARATIVMPTDAPTLKLEATRNYGAEVVFYDRLHEDREAIAQRVAEERGAVIVPPYDDYLVMAGQGTAALELLLEVPSLDVLVTPVGGGGLMAGCSTVARSFFPGIQVYGVEPDTANDTYLSLQKAERVRIPPPPTIADGVRSTMPGVLTFPILKETLTGIVLVTDTQIADAVRFLVERARVVVEPTGAIGVAAALARALPVARGTRVGIVLSGGNIDPDLLARVLRGARG